MIPFSPLAWSGALGHHRGLLSSMHAWHRYLSTQYNYRGHVDNLTGEWADVPAYFVETGDLFVYQQAAHSLTVCNSIN